eukprot:1024633-Rhodomonas_salina.1
MRDWDAEAKGEERRRGRESVVGMASSCDTSVTEVLRGLTAMVNNALTARERRLRGGAHPARAHL